MIGIEISIVADASAPAAATPITMSWDDVDSNMVVFDFSAPVTFTGDDIDNLFLTDGDGVDHAVIPPDAGGPTTNVELAFEGIDGFDNGPFTWRLQGTPTGIVEASRFVVPQSGSQP